jgi:hypothetical protein
VIRLEGQGELVLLDGPPASFHQAPGHATPGFLIVFESLKIFSSVCMSNGLAMDLLRWEFGIWQMMLQWW